ncbi:nucleoside/nucleotide kinase family protein [Deinococcus sp. UYEF24]
MTIQPHTQAELPPLLRASLDDLVARAAAMVVQGERRILGVTGAPGAGKSTLCEALSRALGSDVAVVGMDGFHLANQELERLGRRGRKGAPDTFDSGGYAALLARLRLEPGETIYAPVFNRDLEESIGSAVPVPAGTPLIVTEGNYLLMDAGHWGSVRTHLNEAWFLDLPDDTRQQRLVSRHVAFGRPHDDAQAWVKQVDEPNALAIQATRNRADLIVHLID